MGKLPLMFEGTLTFDQLAELLTEIRTAPAVPCVHGPSGSTIQEGACSRKGFRSV